MKFMLDCNNLFSEGKMYAIDINAMRNVEGTAFTCLNN